MICSLYKVYLSYNNNKLDNWERKKQNNKTTQQQTNKNTKQQQKQNIKNTKKPTKNTTKNNNRCNKINKNRLYVVQWAMVAHMNGRAPYELSNDIIFINIRRRDTNHFVK